MPPPPPPPPGRARGGRGRARRRRRRRSREPGGRGLASAEARRPGRCPCAPRLVEDRLAEVDAGDGRRAQLVPRPRIGAAAAADVHDGRAGRVDQTSDRRPARRRRPPGRSTCAGWRCRGSRWARRGSQAFGGTALTCPTRHHVSPMCGGFALVRPEHVPRGSHDDPSRPRRGRMPLLARGRVGSRRPGRSSDPATPRSRHRSRRRARSTGIDRAARPRVRDRDRLAAQPRGTGGTGTRLGRSAPVTGGEGRQRPAGRSGRRLSRVPGVLVHRRPSRRTAGALCHL